MNKILVRDSSIKKFIKLGVNEVNKVTKVNKVKTLAHFSHSSHFSSLPTLVSILAFSILLIFYTSSAWSATISGKAEIEGRKDMSGVLITAQRLTTQAGGLSGITSNDGTYSIPDVPSGSYTLIAQKPGCLIEIHSDVVVGNSAVTLNFQLIPGDLKIDNQINLLDRIVLTSAWQAKIGDPNWNSMLDIFEDGVIDERDRDLLLSHWREGNSSIELGSLEVLSEPEGATILINGADTGQTTPHTFHGMVKGPYVVMLAIVGYDPRETIVQVRPGEVSALDPSPFILDNEPPEFATWIQDPADLTEDVQGRLRVSVQIIDRGGSGLEGKIPQFSFRIGSDLQFSQYADMTSSGGDLWYFDIPEPPESWNAHRGQFVRYKAKIEDVAGNERESNEQEEPIDDINDSPTIRIISTFSAWERGLLTISAEASDTDGTIVSVQFEYSFDNVRWTQIGSMDTTQPYSVPWDTTEAVREVAGNVWIRATVTDDDSDSERNTTASFGVDNQPPVTSHDYDGEWHSQDFIINLEADDKNGIGVDSISYQLNLGNKQDFPINGQSSAPVRITTESHVNVLEYWSVDKLGNEGSHKTLSNIKLDKTAPIFSDWQKEPGDLTEDSVGIIRLSVRVSDGDGSGLEGNIPQFDYSIGQLPQFDGYEDMVTGDGRVWHFDVMEPADTWNAHRGEQVHYRVISTDLAGNTRESAEQRELIDDINDIPIVNIISRFNLWEKGLLTITAEASDTDGTIAGVQFEYSPDDGITWAPIGPADTLAPFSVDWDTTVSITQAQSVRIKATGTDDSGGSASSVYPTPIGIDNQSPVTMHDYDNQWHTDDFAIVLTISDGSGIGVSNSNVKYKIDNGDERSLATDGQPWITGEGLSQLEYWSVDSLENEESHHILRNIKLDKTRPVFVDWIQDPSNLTEDNSGPLQVSVRVVDDGGSGLEEKIAQFSYRIGRNSQFSRFEDMIKSGADNVWYFDIPEPIDSWNAHRGEEVSYKAKIEDVAGNSGESAEQKELIDDINDLPTVIITSTFGEWEEGLLTIEAEASDTDGTITGVQFEYSPNRVTWTSIGALITVPPYSITWSTETSIPGVEETIWIKATTTDDDGQSTEFNMPRSLSIDNQPPITTDDYNGLWHNADFFINLTSGDGNGIGVASVSYRLNFGQIQEVPLNGRVSVPVNISTEGPDSILEYWSVDKLGNEGTHQTLTAIKMDKTAPVFSGWQQDPADLTEDTVGRFRVSVQVTDEGGSGLEGKTPQIDYHIGTETQYDGYENMTGGSWFFDIPEPPDTWNSHQGERVHYKTRIEDIAGNVTEILEERLELIDSVNDVPVVSITSIFDVWEGEKVIIGAQASDVDGSAPSVQFEYSVNAIDWMLVGVTSASPPVYSIEWNTKAAIPVLERIVWIKAKATDADDTSVSVEVVILKSFGVDNQSPTLGVWSQTPVDLTEDTNGSFRVQVDIDDGIGSGVTKVELAYRIGNRIVRPFNEMIKGPGASWYFDIPEPSNTWDFYRGETLFYSAVATDLVGNGSLEVTEQQELIDSINDSPRGVITSTFDDWERGSLTLRANATDDDGQVTTVQFQYSSNNVTWINIGPGLINIPYTAIWDTTSISMDPDIWIQAVVTDNNGISTSVPYIRSIGIDNAAPTFSEWNHTDLTEDSNETFFRIEVRVTDQGSGVDGTKVQVDYRIGTSGYVGYTNMFSKTTDVWFYEVPRPSPWNNFAGETLFYRVRAADITGNVAESAEQRELIEATTGSISGNIFPRESWQFGSAKVAAQQNGFNVKPPVSVSAQNGSYSITGLQPGFYDLEVTSQGYGVDRSMTNIQVIAGQASPNHDVTLYTYTVAELTRSQGGSVEYIDAQLKEYRLIIGSNDLGSDGTVVLGVSGKEPTAVPNPEVQLMGKAIGIGFEGKGLSAPIQLVMPRPAGISDGNAIMTFIYDGKAQSYRFVDRDNIAPGDPTITITIDPGDVSNFNDDSHNFTQHLNRVSDTVFYVLVTEFNKPPQLTSSERGILDPQIFPGRVASYSQPNINVNDQTIAVVIPGITSRPDDMVNLISDLRSLKNAQMVDYYDHVLIFNYEPNNAIGSSGDFLLSELSALSNQFSGQVDIVAHGMGGLVARSAIVSTAAAYTGSLTMLGVPHGGVSDALLRDGFADFLLKTQSDPTWTYYGPGWRDMLTNSPFLSSLNSQPGRQVDTHYYGIGASNLAATIDNDDLAFMGSMDFTIGFPSMEQPLTEAFEAVSVPLPASEDTGFMSRTRHVGMLSNINVRSKVVAYLLGKSQNIQYERYDGDLIPGLQLVDTFTVELKNVGTETVLGVSGQLSTSNSFIRKFSGNQGIEDDTASFGNILPGATESGTFSFAVSSSAAAAFGQQIIFSLLITNSEDSSISTQTFEAPIGGDIIKIALDASENKRVAINVMAINPERLMNDGDPAVEPGEVMSLAITMKNESTGTIPNVTVTLKTDDTRVVGLVDPALDPVGVNEIDLVNDGIQVSYGTFSSSLRVGTFQFVKVNDDFTSTLLGDTIHFTLEIRTGGIFFGSDEFDLKVGADIIVDSIDFDRRLVPDGGLITRGISVRLRNTTSNPIGNVRLTIDSDARVDVRISPSSVTFPEIRANGTSVGDFDAEIFAGFSGNVLFTLDILVSNQPLNTETSQHYFGKRTQHVTHWVSNDMSPGDRDGIAEPGEAIRLQVARWNPTSEEVLDVRTTLSTTDTAILMRLSTGDYFNILENQVLDLTREYEFDIANAGNVSAPSGSVLDTVNGNKLTLAGADWIRDALLGGILNPNTGQTAVVFEITGNDETSITVATPTTLLTDVAADGDPFTVTMPATSSELTAFQLRGHTVDFNIDVEENFDSVGQETFSMRIGGIIQYLRPTSYSNLLLNIDDSPAIDPNNLNNDGDGIPEPGETIEITVRLRNISNIFDVSRVFGILRGSGLNNGNVSRVDTFDQEFDTILRGRDSQSRRYIVTIDDEIRLVGNILTLELSIDGDIGSSSRLDLGKDIFTIPITIGQ